MFLTEAANRGSISTGYDIDNSCKLEADNTEYLNRVIASGGNRKTFTISAWVKRTEISDTSHGGGHTIFAVNVSGNEGTILRFNTGTTAATLDTIQIDIGAGGTLSRSHTSQVFRDTAAWYHIVLAVDTTQSTATDRFKLYVNGELVTSYYSRNNPAQNFDTANNQADNSCTQHIGAYTVSGTAYGKFCGYIAEVNHVDGAALAPTAFGEFDDNGIWIPIEASPTYGTNGFFLDFADSGNLGDDESGNGLDFTEVNIAAADQSTDTPTNNFCTLNPLVVYGNALTTGPIEGATKVTGGSWAGTKGTMGVENGKWYYEFKTSGGDSIVGIQTDEGVALTGNGHNILSTCGFYVGTGGEVWIKDSTSGRNDRDVTHTFNASTINGIAINMDDNQISFYQNGSLVTNGGNIDLDGLSNKTVFPFASNYNTTQEFNFGGYTTISISSAATDENGYGTFEYAPPSGYYALCTKNLAEYGG